MNPIRCIASAKSLLLVAAVFFLGGCGDETATPPVRQQVFEQIPEKKLADLQKAAARGDADAQYKLGRIYAVGDGVPKDSSKAVEWYQKAAAQGNADAENNLGWAYANGEGVPKDVSKAIEWFHKAAAQGDADAQYRLGRIYAKGDGVPRDVSKAVEWYQKAAVQGHSDAQVSLGGAYFNGGGVSKDLSKAVEWFQKAAAQGNATAENNLGFMYFDGIGVPKDVSKAVEWFHKAAAQGNNTAQGFLGWMYSAGKGVPKDMVIAYAWSNVAASGGSESADRDRSFYENFMSPLEVAEAQRLSSAWKPGQIVGREGRSVSASASAVHAGKLTKQKTGSLFVVSKTGRGITNQHVVQDCSELRIEGREGVAKKVIEDVVNDLALVQIPGEVNATASIVANPSKLRQGEDVVVFGFPLNAVLSSGGNLTPGVVSALTGLGNNINQIQITAPVQSGSSGSPVLNKTGEVVGVVSMKLDDEKMAKLTGQIGQNVNFAVSGQTLKTFLDTHKVEYRTRGWFALEQSTVDLADEARKWTLVVECWK